MQAWPALTALGYEKKDRPQPGPGRPNTEQGLSEGCIIKRSVTDFVTDGKRKYVVPLFRQGLNVEQVEHGML